MSAEMSVIGRADRTSPWVWIPLLFSAVIVVVSLFLVTIGIVGLRYPRLINNNPLQAPIQVVAINGTKLDLADGRVVELESPLLTSSEIQQSLQNSQMLVDVEAADPTFPHDVTLYVKQRQFICGTPWASVIRIPLFPDNIDANRKWVLGFGNIRSPHPIPSGTSQGGP